MTLLFHAVGNTSHPFFLTVTEMGVTLFQLHRGSNFSRTSTIVKFRHKFETTEDDVS